MVQKIIYLLKRSQNAYSLASNLAQAVLNLLLFFVMVRLLTPELYGQWIIYITAASLIDMLRLGLTGTAAIRAISTTKAEEQKQYIGTSYRLNISATIILSIVFLLSFILSGVDTNANYYSPVLAYYPLLAIANLPFNQSLTYNQGIFDFKRILFIRLINSSLNLLSVLVYISVSSPDIQGVIIAHLCGSFIASTIVQVLQWDGLKYCRNFDKQKQKELLKFGKYATASYVGSNLLRSSDTFILSLSASLGAEAIAVFAIPLKFVEFIEIPLRSFTATAFPKLSQAISQSKQLFSSTLASYLLLSAFMLIPALLLLLVFPGFLLQLLGGVQYADSLELQRSILFLVIIYIVILPVDRFSGVALFALNRPEINFLKIMIMLISNILFDLIAVFWFESLYMVMVATLVFTLVGIVVGWYYITSSSRIAISQIMQEFKNPQNIKSIISF